MTKSISTEFIQMAARILKTLGHPDRIKIVEYLEDGEKTVGQIIKTKLKPIAIISIGYANEKPGKKESQKIKNLVKHV